MTRSPGHTIKNVILLIFKASSSSSTLYEDLKNGIVCYDSDTRTKYWLNCYEQIHQPYVNHSHKRVFNLANISANSLSSNGTITLNDPPTHGFIVSYNITLTPLFIFCSYLPYELNIEFEDKSDSVNKKTSVHSIKPNMVSYLNDACFSECSGSNMFQLAFDHVLNNRVTRDSETEESESVLNRVIQIFEIQNSECIYRNF